jgi:hypothetical protein
VATKTEIQSRLNLLQPERTRISAVLAFIRLVVLNNPTKSTADINKRSDVKQALAEVNDWGQEVSVVAKDIVNLLPSSKMAKPIFDAVTTTVDKLKQDTRITEQNRDEWEKSTQDRESWGARILLRMSWLLSWLGSQLNNLTIEYPYKIWRSRLAPNSCRFCRGLNGGILPINQSFRAEARRLGVKRIYGGLFAPPLHPYCQCTLLGISEEQYEAIKQGLLILS